MTKTTFVNGYQLFCTIPGAVATFDMCEVYSGLQIIHRSLNACLSIYMPCDCWRPDLGVAKLLSKVNQHWLQMHPQTKISARENGWIGILRAVI